mmetsp:Transcript_23604/g.47873  ORF Transcript_23604/g.47873 Transcript_23604/m.47873 type:complete len:232 (+) Transcript_23604:521-1216(+)
MLVIPHEFRCNSLSTSFRKRENAMFDAPSSFMSLWPNRIERRVQLISRAEASAVAPQEDMQLLDKSTSIKAEFAFKDCANFFTPVSPILVPERLSRIRPELLLKNEATASKPLSPNSSFRERSSCISERLNFNAIERFVTPSAPNPLSPSSKTRNDRLFPSAEARADAPLSPAPMLARRRQRSREFEGRISDSATSATPSQETKLSVKSRATMRQLRRTAGTNTERSESWT